MYLIEKLVHIFSAQHTQYAQYLICFSLNFMAIPVSWRFKQLFIIDEKLQFLHFVIEITWLIGINASWGY